MRVEVPAGSVVVINFARGIDIADDEIRADISIEIHGYHRVRHTFFVFPYEFPRVRFLELNAEPEIPFAVIEVNKAAELLRASGDVRSAESSME
jgi:hypothetical protein